MSTREKIKQRRLDRMRLGQSAADVVTLPSDSEIKLYIVPLREGEFLSALEAVASYRPPVDEIAAYQLRERRQAQEILVRAIREPHNLQQQVYQDVDELMEDLDITDVDECIDNYNLMVEKSSPSIEGIPPEELEELKKVLQEVDWNALSGRAWYAAKRFLSEIGDQLLLVSSRGSGSTNSSTTTKDSEESTHTASQSS
jgi:hypothetical protein